MSASNDKSQQQVGTLITVGFMPVSFPRLFTMLLPCIDHLPRPIIVQAGCLSSHPFFDFADFVIDFSSQEQMRQWARTARLIICHAGVGNVQLANSLNLMPVVFPRYSDLGEHIDDHQIELTDILVRESLALAIHLDCTSGDIRDEITKALSFQAETARQIIVSTPKVELGATTLAVSSVGGHRSELQRFIKTCGSSSVINMTDEFCEEVKFGSLLRFPSCNKRRHIPIRLVQALVFLVRNRRIDTVLTTGAGVGAIFVLAAKILGRRTISIESITRVKAPGLWFKLAGRISDESYAYSWATWAKKYPSVKIIDVNVTSNNTSVSN